MYAFEKAARMSKNMIESDVCIQLRLSLSLPSLRSLFHIVITRTSNYCKTKSDPLTSSRPRYVYRLLPGCFHKTNTILLGLFSFHDRFSCCKSLAKLTTIRTGCLWVDVTFISGVRRPQDVFLSPLFCHPLRWQTVFSCYSFSSIWS